MKQNCVLCGQFTDDPFCSHCISKAREYSNTIREYIASNPGTSILDIYTSTSIPFTVIKGLLEMGWLELNVPK